MHSVAFLQDLAVVMMLAGLVTVLFHQMGQPVVLGYILAGMIIGPHTPPFGLVTDEESIKTLADVGVVLLMFSLGLDFNLGKLKRVGGPAVIAALLEIFAMGWTGYELGRLFGWGTTDSLFLGAMLSMSSTTIIVKVLAEFDQMRERFAQLIFGILIIEDILGIAMIALLSGIGTTGALGAGAVGVTLGKLGVFLVVVLVAGLILVPRLLGYVARFKRDEMLLVTVLALCFGVSLLAAKMGYSVALGAFVIGAVVAEAREIHRIETLIGPVRDMFSAVFFVAIGLMIDPGMLPGYWVPILVITVAVLVCKVAACSAGTFLGGNDGRTSLKVGMGVAQIGEFSFIIAALGLSLKVTSDFIYPVAVAVSAITTLLTPYMIRGSDGLADRLARRSPRWLADSLVLYTRWVGSMGGSGHRSLAIKLTRRWLAQMGLNLAMMAGVFIGAAYLGRKPPPWLMGIGVTGDRLNALLWLVAMICSLPLIVATFLKLRAWAMLIAETRVSPHRAGEHTGTIRAIVTHVVTIAGSAALGLYAMVLTSSILPAPKVFVVLVFVVALVAWLLRRSFVRLYSTGQVALMQTFAQPADPRPEVRSLTLPPPLRNAEMETVVVRTGSRAAGQLIGELMLRSETGASIVAMERAGVSIVNPGPDEELLLDDQVLLLGTEDQLRAAKAFFDARKAAST